MITSHDQLLCNINFFAEEVDFPALDVEKTIQWVQKTISEESKTYQGLNIIFCSDEFLLRLNKEHLKHDYYTDIITFQYQDEPIEGELYISLDRVQANAQSQIITFDIELYRVIIHGILHLIGYGDKTEEEIKTIRAKEDYYLQHLQ